MPGSTTKNSIRRQCWTKIGNLKATLHFQNGIEYDQVQNAIAYDRVCLPGMACRNTPSSSFFYFERTLPAPENVADSLLESDMKVRPHARLAESAPYELGAGNRESECNKWTGGPVIKILHSSKFVNSKSSPKAQERT